MYLHIIITINSLMATLYKHDTLLRHHPSSRRYRRHFARFYPKPRQAVVKLS